jgi:hypothetical protein
MSGTNGRGLRHVRWLQGPLKLLAAGAVLMSIVGVGAIVPVAAPYATAATPPAVGVPNHRTYIFNTFANDPSAGLSSYISAITADLTQASYPPKTLKPTVKDFHDLAGAGIAIIYAHSDATDGLNVEPMGVCKTVVHTLNPLDQYCQPSGTGYDDPAFDAAYSEMQKEGGTLGLTVAPKTNTTLATADLNLAAGVYNGGLDWAIDLRPSGISKLLGSQTMGIVVVAGCHSLGNPLASSFPAKAYFGYPGFAEQCSLVPVNGTDTQHLFDQLVGRNGVGQRTTTTANGFTPLFGFGLANPNGQPVTLNPAVISALPAAGSVVGGGGGGTPGPPPSGGLVKTSGLAAKHTRADQRVAAGRTTESSTVVPGSVQFDTEMDTSNNPNSVIKVAGCGAKLQKGSASWGDDGSSLSFNFTVPQNATGTATLTVSDHKAEAESGGKEGPNDFLDGNQSPSPANGEAPNDSDYAWTVNCNNGQISATVTYSATLTTMVRNHQCPGNCETQDFDLDGNLTVNYSETTTCDVSGGAPSGCTFEVTENSASGSQTTTYFPQPGGSCMATYSGVDLQFASPGPAGAIPASFASNSGSWTVDWGGPAGDWLDLTGTCGPSPDPLVFGDSYMYNALWAPGQATFTESFSQSLGGSACEPNLEDFYGNPTTYCQNATGSLTVSTSG